MRNVETFSLAAGHWAVTLPEFIPVKVNRIKRKFKEGKKDRWRENYLNWPKKNISKFTDKTHPLTESRLESSNESSGEPCTDIQIALRKELKSSKNHRLLNINVILSFLCETSY